MKALLVFSIFALLGACAPEADSVTFETSSEATGQDEDGGVELAVQELSRPSVCWSGTRKLLSVEVSVRVQFCYRLEETGCYKAYAVPYGAWGGCSAPRANVELYSTWLKGWYPLSYAMTCQWTADKAKEQLLDTLTCNRVRATNLGTADCSTQRVVP